MAKRIPSLNWLRVFEAAARSGSFARASERLAMSPPAVSQQVRALEEHLGRQLFERAPAGVTLTEAGRSLLYVVSDSLGRMETAAQVLSRPTPAPLVIGVSLTLYAGWLAPRLSGFLDQHPETTLEVHSLIGRPETPPRDAALWVAFGPPPPGTDSIPLFGETLVPVAHPETAAQISNAEDLTGHRLIEVRDHMRNWAQLLSFDVLPAEARMLYVDTTAAALSLAHGKCGIALARPPATDRIVEKLGLVTCLPDLGADGVERYHIVTPSHRALPAATRALRDWLVLQAKTAL